MHNTSAADFSKETLKVKEEETHDAGVFERVEAEVVKLLKEPPSLVEPPPRIVNITPRIISVRQSSKSAAGIIVDIVSMK